jgi:HlyD family secretion protein
MHGLSNSSKAPTVVPQSAESPQPPVVQRPEPPHRHWKWWLVGGVAIAALGVGIWYWRFRAQPILFIPLSGRIEGYETDVSTKGAGRVEAVTVREGATVKKGQLLVRLSNDGVQSELKAATSQVEAAKQREAAARLQISVMENQVADARLNLQQTEGDTDGKVAEAEGLVATAQALFQQEEARVGEATALLEQTKTDRDRYASLASKGAETE